jgi:hypothetical protein
MPVARSIRSGCNMIIEGVSDPNLIVLNGIVQLM